MPYAAFDRTRLLIKPLAERQHDLDLSHMLDVDAPVDFTHLAIPVLGQRLVTARESGAATVLA